MTVSRHRIHPVQKASATVNPQNDPFASRMEAGVKTLELFVRFELAADGSGREVLGMDVDVIVVGRGNDGLEYSRASLHAF